MVPKKTERFWYIVMNSNRARILRELPDRGDPAPIEITMQGPRRKLWEILKDRPTHSFSGAGGGWQSSIEPGSDPLQEDARSFLEALFDFLEQQRIARAFDWLVLIAPPQTIGLWREEIPETLQACVRREIARNLMRFRSAELVAALRALTASG